MGYDDKGRKIADPNSNRQQRLYTAKAKQNPPPPPPKALGEGTPRPSTVNETFRPSIIGGIFVLGGSNLRTVRDGLVMCYPGVIPPEEIQSKPFWKVIKKCPFPSGRSVETQKGG